MGTTAESALTMDYRIDLKVSNNRILRFLEDLGYASVMDLCRRAKLSLGTTYNLVNLKECPRDKNGNWRKPAVDLARALCCEPDDLFSDEQQYFPLEKNRAYVQLSQSQINSFLPNLFPDEQILAIEDSRDMKSMIEASMEELTERERFILTMRFGIAPAEKEHTLEQIGRRLGVTRDRIRQIEAKAMRKVRAMAYKQKWPIREQFGNGRGNQ